MGLVVGGTALAEQRWRNSVGEPGRRELDGWLLIRILCRGRHVSYQRGKRNTNPGTSLIKIEGVDDTNAAKYVQLPDDGGGRC